MDKPIFKRVLLTLGADEADWRSNESAPLVLCKERIAAFLDPLVANRDLPILVEVSDAPFPGSRELEVTLYWHASRKAWPVTRSPGKAGPKYLTTGVAKYKGEEFESLYFRTCAWLKKNFPGKCRLARPTDLLSKAKFYARLSPNFEGEEIAETPNKETGPKTLAPGGPEIADEV